MTDDRLPTVRAATPEDIEDVFELATLMALANGAVAWVEEIAVHGRCRRRGLGRLPMRAYEDQVRARGVRLVALATTRAGPFYESLGYVHHAAYYRRVP